MNIKELIKQIDEMSALTKMSLATAVIVTATIPAFMLKLLSAENMRIILYAGLGIQLILFTYVIIKYISMTRFTRYRMDQYVRVVRCTFRDKHIKGDTYVFPEFVSPTNPNNKCIFCIMVETENSEELPGVDVHIENNGQLNIERFSSDIDREIIKDVSLFYINVTLTQEEKMNIKFQKDVYIKFFVLGELYIP